MAVIGIDLGTTYSVMAYVKDGIPTIIPNAEGGHLTPSVVGFDRNGHFFVGEFAASRAILDTRGTIASIKRKMGTNYTVNVHGHEYTPVMISSFILGKLKKDAESRLREEVKEAVVTVPAYFSDIARQATKNAAEVAGLKVLRIINEPTAATLAYGLDQKEGELVMVWDLGGGTFDVSILEFAGGVYEVKATCGDMQLGGDDWRDILTQYLVEEYQMVWGKADHPETFHRIVCASEEVKKELTSKESVSVVMPHPRGLRCGKKVLKVAVERAQFEGMTRHLCDRLIGPARQALKDAGIKKTELDKVIMVGGATRMPMVRQRVAEFVGKEPFVDIDPDEVVAIGAAIQAGVLTGSMKEVVLVDVIPLSLGIETQGGVFTKLIERNSKVPISKDRIFTTASDNQPEVDIHVLQGERALVEQNVSLGKFTLSGIPEAPKGMPRINVTFSVDVNGILNVLAEDVYTGNEREMVVRSDRLGEADIAKLVEEAERHHESDQQIKEKIVARVELDRLIQAAKRSLDELDVQGDTDLGVEAEGLIEEAERLMEKGETSELKGISKKIEEVMDAIYKKWKRVAETGAEAKAG